MKIKPSLFLKLCLFAVLPIAESMAQHSDSPQTSSDPYKFDVSLDLYNLFYKGEAGVMLRYALSPKGALRLRLEGSVGKTEHAGQLTQGGPTVPLMTYKSYVYDVALGYEFHKNRDRFQLFYGPEVSYRRQLGEFTYYPGYANPKISPPDISIFRAGAFVGLKYYILKRLSVSSETHLSYSRLTNKAYDFDNPGILVIDSRSNFVSFTGLRFLNVSFHFN